MKEHSPWSVKGEVRFVGEGQRAKRLERKAGPGLAGPHRSRMKFKFHPGDHGKITFLNRGMMSSKYVCLCFGKTTLAACVEHD